MAAANSRPPPSGGWARQRPQHEHGRSDGDGDLDVVVNNLNSPAQLRTACAAGTALTLDLRWPGPVIPMHSAPS